MRWIVIEWDLSARGQQPTGTGTGQYGTPTWLKPELLATKVKVLIATTIDELPFTATWNGSVTHVC